MKLTAITTLVVLVFGVFEDISVRTVYTISDGLPANEVRAIYNDPTGSIWIGSGAGAASLANSQWNVDSRAINPVTKGVSTIFKDSRGNLWFGGLNMCHVYDGTTYRTYSILENMNVNGRVVFSFHEDDNQNIWAATTGGISIFDGSSWRPFTTEHGLKHNVVHDVKQGENGDFWFATRKGGLNIYDGSNWEYLYPEKNCRKLLKDDLGNMWVGTNDGIIQFDGEKWRVYEEGKTVLPMFKGKKGFVWCISEGTDIIRISPDGRSIHYEDPTDTKANEIYHLEWSEDGSVWAGTDQGVFVFH